MAQTCRECGAPNQDSDRFCRACGQPLGGKAGQARHAAESEGKRAAGPLAAITLITVLLLCCLGIIGVTLLDELMPGHPLRTVLESPPTSTHAPVPTLAPVVTVTVAPAPTSQTGADSFEPDDSVDQASDIATDGTAQTHNLSPVGDRDYISFRAKGAMAYTIETGDLGPNCDTIVSLYDQEGRLLASDDDGADEPWASRVTWVAQEDATLFVEVAQYSQGSEQEATEYDIWVRESEPVRFEEDEYEPDDTMAKAREIVLGAPQTHNIHVLGDRDWVFFRAEEGVTYDIVTFGLGRDVDTIIYLYDESGEELAQDDDGSGEGLASRITWTADSAGTLYVMIRDYWSTQVHRDMGYGVVVSEVASLATDLDSRFRTEVPGLTGHGTMRRTRARYTCDIWNTEESA
jgi:hypothetical protein